MNFKKKIVLTEKQKKDLARLSGAEFARKYRKIGSTVYSLRIVYGVTKLNKRYQKFENTKSRAYRDLQLLSARQLIKKYGILESMVYRLRRRLGVKKLYFSAIAETSMTPGLLSDLKRLSGVNIATKYKMPINRVYLLKKKLGLIRIPFFQSLTDEQKKDLATMNNEDAALKFMVCTRTIARAKEKLGVYGKRKKKQVV